MIGPETRAALEQLAADAERDDDRQDGDDDRGVFATMGTGPVR